MKCREAQALITEYVEEQLDLKTLEAFLQHIKSCPDCMEELEVYYIVFNGIKRLDEDENIAVNYHAEFEHEIKRSEQKIKKAKTRFNVKRGVYIALCLFAVLVCSIQLGRIEIRKQLYKSEGPSTYDLPYYFSKGNDTRLEQYVIKSSGNQAGLENKKDNVRSNQ